MYVSQHIRLPSQKLFVTLQSKYHMRNDQEYHNEITVKTANKNIGSSNVVAKRKGFGPPRIATLEFYFLANGEKRG